MRPKVLGCELLGSRLQGGQLGGTGTGELDLAHADVLSGDGEIKGFDGAVQRTRAKIIGAAFQVAFNGEGLQGVGNLIRELAGHRKLALE